MSLPLGRFLSLVLPEWRDSLHMTIYKRKQTGGSLFNYEYVIVSDVSINFTFYGKIEEDGGWFPPSTHTCVIYV